MSSGCAPSAIIDRTPASDRASIPLPGQDAVGGQRRQGQRRGSSALRVPEHPRALSTMEHVLQLGPVLERVGVAQYVEDGRPQDEVAAVLPLHQLADFAYAAALTLLVDLHLVI